MCKIISQIGQWVQVGFEVGYGDNGVLAAFAVGEELDTYSFGSVYAKMHMGAGRIASIAAVPYYLSFEN